jgi:hypothetical protein
VVAANFFFVSVEEVCCFKSGDEIIFCYHNNESGGSIDFAPLVS